MEDTKLIAFLTLLDATSNDGYIGAILITDVQGVPQEFRCTHPVKPTAIQKPLYGDTLEPYIGVELCGRPLLQSVQNRPSLVVVGKEFLLDLRTSSSCPVIFVRRAGEAIEVSSSDSGTPAPSRQRIECSTGRFQPIMILAHSDYQDDSSVARPFVEEIFAHLDLLEPFDRVAKATEVLAKQDRRFQ